MSIPQLRRPRIGLGVILCAAVGMPAATAPAAPAAAQEPLPYDLAFDMRQFLWSTTLAVTPDGGRVAYAVRQPPPDVERGARFMPNGSPSSVMGARLYISDGSGTAARDVCPGGNCWRPAWSPDGRRLAFYSDRDGPPQLWLHDLASGETRKVTSARVKAKLWAGDEAQWSPDGRTVYMPIAPDSGPGSWLPDPHADGSADARGGDSMVVVYRSGIEDDQDAGAGKPSPLASHMMRENSASLAAVAVRTGEVRVLADASDLPRPSVLRVSPSGRWISYLSVFKEHGMTNQVSTIDLAVVPSAGGEIHVIAEDLPVLDDYHRLNYSWAPDGDRLVYFRDDGLWLVEVGRGGPARPRRLAADLGPLAPTVHWFTRDGDAVVVGTDPVDDRGYGDPRPEGIAVVPLDGQPPRRFTIGERWTYREVIRSDARTVWQPDGRSTSLVVEDRTTGETAVLRLDHDSGRSRVLWQGLARLSSLTGGGSHGPLLAIYEDVSTPPDVYRFDADFGDRQRISHIDPRLDAIAVGSAEVFETTVPLHDGTLASVRSSILLPPGATRGDRLPTLVGIYPGADRSRDAATFGGGGSLTVPNLLFTSRGYAVLLVHLKLGPNRVAGQPLQEMVDVLLPQVYRAAELGYVDVSRLAIGGQSYGGYGTGSVIAGTNLFRAAIAVSGIYDLAGTYGHMDDDGGSFWVGWSEGGQARMGTHPWADLRRYTDNSPYHRADRIHTPLLLIHGDADMAYHDAVKLFSALRRLDRPVELARYRGQGHVVYEWKQSSATDAARRMVDFLEQRLGKPGHPAGQKAAGAGEGASERPDDPGR